MFRRALLKLMISGSLLLGAQSAYAENRLALLLGLSEAVCLARRDALEDHVCGRTEEHDCVKAGVELALVATQPETNRVPSA